MRRFRRADSPCASPRFPYLWQLLPPPAPLIHAQAPTAALDSQEEPPQLQLQQPFAHPSGSAVLASTSATLSTHGLASTKSTPMPGETSLQAELPALVTLTALLVHAVPPSPTHLALLLPQALSSLRPASMELPTAPQYGHHTPLLSPPLPPKVELFRDHAQTLLPLKHSLLTSRLLQ